MKLSTSLKVGTGLAVMLVFLLLVAISALLSARMMARSAGLVERTLDVESDLSDLENAMLAAESATRGFLVTGDDRYLASFRDAPALAREELEGLRRKTADDPVQLRHIDAVEPLIVSKIARMQRTVDLWKRGSMDAAVAEVKSGVGRELMAEIRRRLHSMQREEERLAAQRAAAELRGARRTERFIVLTAILAAGFVSVAGVLIRRDLLGRRRAEEALRDLSMVDELTGLYNRRGFLIHAEDRVKFAARLGTREVLVFADVDGLKSINDTFGHFVGDEAITAAAGLLRSSFRDTDVVARIGGDEFVVLALMDRDEDVEVPIRSLRAAIQAWNAHAGMAFRLSMSVGTTYFEPGTRLEELIAAADRKMYA
ncbi:MAG TPA: CHASE3 domain-containing protein, partial [Thermoanaerobaculia bacterium]|nr:CHASE3 domain-containing protein [Thermoanaerobaculia bacterium]